MAVLLDTSVLIAAERGTLDLTQYPDTQPLMVAAITWSELWMGVHLAGNKQRQRQRRQVLESLLQGLDIIAFDAGIAETHARIYAGLYQQGKRIGAHDLIIAATAIAKGVPVFTLNTKEFKQVEGLELYNPLPRR